MAHADATPYEPGEVLLDVRDLRTTFKSEFGLVKAVDGVSFTLSPGEVLGIVGESGSGKSVTVMSILRLLPKRVSTTTGEVRFRGQDLLTLPLKDLRKVRGAQIAMVFQDALTALNPVHKVGAQIAEMIRAHRDVSKKQAMAMAADLLDLVGIPNAQKRANDYVHEFSGGMRQRAMIAMAIALEPDVLIADEPTTALDVTVQAQIMDTLLHLRETLGMAMILITHDLGVVAGTAHRVMVMYGGKKVEEHSVDGIYGAPKHPYTWGLLKSIPRVDGEEGERLYQILGAPPSLIEPPSGCRFAARCDYVRDVCRAEYPELREIGVGHTVSCHFADRGDWTTDLDPTDFAATEVALP